MKSGKTYLYTLITALAVIGISPYCEAKPKKKQANSDNPIFAFLKENGINPDKKAIAIQVTGKTQTGEGQIAVLKLISIKQEPNLKKMKFASKKEEEAAKKELAFIKQTNITSAYVIKTVVNSIMNGTVIKDGDTVKVADLQVIFEDKSTFDVVVGEDFSQIVFEKIISQPENPFSSEPVEKSVKTLSFISPVLVKSVRLIIQPEME